MLTPNKERDKLIKLCMQMSSNVILQWNPSNLDPLEPSFGGWIIEVSSFRDN